MPETKSLQDTLTNIRKQFNIFTEKVKDTSFIKFISSSIKTIDNIIKAIETVLKNRGIDIDKYKEKTKEFGSKVKSKAAFAIDTVKEVGKETFKSFKPETQNKILKAKDTIMNMINRFKTSPPEETEEGVTKEPKEQSLFTKLDNYLQDRKNKIIENKIKEIEDKIKDIRSSKLLLKEEKDVLIAKLVEEKVKFDNLLMQDKRYLPRITNFFTDKKEQFKQSLLNTKNKVIELLFKFRNDRIKAKKQRLEDKIKEIEDNKTLTNDEKIKLIEKIIEKENILDEDLEDRTYLTGFLKRRLNIFTDKITNMKNKAANAIKNQYNKIKDSITNKISDIKGKIDDKIFANRREEFRDKVTELRERIKNTEDPIEKQKLLNQLIEEERKYKKHRANRKKRSKEDTSTSTTEKTATEAKAETKPNILTTEIGLIGELLSNINIRKPKSTEDKIKDDIERTNKEIARQEEKMKKRRGILDKFKEKAKPKEDDFFGKLLSKLMTFGGFLLGGLKTLIWSPIKWLGKRVIPWLGGFLFKGIEKIFTAAIPSLVKGIGNVVKGLFNPVSLAKGAWAGIKTGFKLLRPFAGTALRAAGQIGMTALRFAGPVGIAVTGAYLAWKFYKYLTRNDLKDGIPGKLTKLRLMQYGLNDENKDEYYKIFELELKLKDNIKFARNKIQIDTPNEDLQEEIFKLFNIGEEDKEKKQIFEIWFKNRFMYVFASHIKALYNINSSIYLDEIEKLKPEEFKQYMETFVTNTRIYSYKQLPLDKIVETTVTKEKVDELIVEIRKLIEEKIGKKVDEAKIVGQKTLDSSKQAKPNIPKPPDTKSQDTPKPADIKPPKPIKNKPLVTDDLEPTTTEKIIDETKNKVSNIGKLNKAEGDLIPGGDSLTGLNIKKVGIERYYNLDPNIRELFSGMAKEYNSLTGKEIQVNEAFRTYEDQQKLAQKYPDKAAKPGSSPHEKGIAIDIPTAIANELEELGLLRKYGFTRPIGKETWHLEPIGVSLDPLRAKIDPEFRRTAILASPGKGGGGYGTIENSSLGKRNIPLQYEIYNTNADNKIDIAKVTDKTIQNIAKKENLETTKKAIDTSENKGLLSKNIEEKLPNKQTEQKTNTKPANENIEPKEGITVAKSIPSNDINKNIDLSKYKNISVDESITLASRLTGVEEKVLRTFAQLESGFRTNAKASTSSAKGLMQFVDNTWKAMVNKYGPRYGIPSNASQDNPLYSSIMAAEYIRENLNSLSKYKNKVNIDEGTMAYLAHHYGATGASRILEYYSTKPEFAMAKAISDEAYAANKSSIGDKSVGEYISGLQNKFNVAYQTANKTEAKYDTTLASNTITFTPNKQNTVLASNTTPASSNAGLIKISNTDIRNTNIPIDTAKLANKPLSTYTPKPTTPPVATNTIKFDTGSMESILNQQLNALNTVVGILTNINDKIDINKLANILPNKENTIKVNNDIKLSNTNVSVKRNTVI